MKMKRFVTFHGEKYYPAGGIGDYHSSYNTMDEAEAKLTELKFEETKCGPGHWIQLVDTENFDKDSCWK